MAEVTRPSFRGPVALTLVLGLVITGLLAAIARVNYSREEQSLETLETSLAASTVETQLFNLERPLLQVLGAAASSSSPVETFRRIMATSLAPKGPFVSATLMKVKDGKCVDLLHLGVSPLEDPNGKTSSAVCTAAHKLHTFITFRPEHGSAQRLGYALETTGPAGTFVVRASKALPNDRHIFELPSSAFTRLELAVYFGRSTAHSALIESNATKLPISGDVTKFVEPFGTNVLTVAAAPRTALTGTLSQILTWLILGGGLLTSVASAMIVHLLAARRRRAEIAADENQEALRLQEGIAHELQHALLPQALPEMAGIEYGVRYLPEMRGVDVGGDWYDVIKIDDDAIFLSIGDVSGHGLDAATMMGGVRSSIRAFASEDPRPDSVLQRLAGLYAHTNENHFATVCCGTINPSSREASFATAGHLPPLVVTKKEAHFLNAVPGPPIGVGLSRYRPIDLSLTEDATMLFYTDGLVERRGETITEGLQRLLDVALPADPLEPFLDRVLENLVPAGAHDDVALMAISYEPSSVAEKVSHSCSFDPQPLSISAARRFVREDTVGLSDAIRQSAALIVTELTTNAVVHAKSPYVLTVERSIDLLRIEVRDHAPRTSVKMSSPRSDSTHGRGLPLVNALASDWGVATPEDGLTKTVWCALKLRGSASSQDAFSFGVRSRRARLQRASLDLEAPS